MAINSTLRINECANCIDNEPHFEKILSIALFGEGTRELLHALKYEKGFYVIKDLMKILENFEPSKNYLKDAILVPVPLHKKRIKKRKFNQSLLLAKAIVKIFPENNLKVAEILRRSKDTQSQTTLGKPERRRNVENAFKILETNYDIPKSSKIILLDDVATTGATLSECAKVLKKSGFKNVYAFALFKRL